MKDQRNNQRLYRDILKSLINQSSTHTTIRYNTLIPEKIVKSSLYTLLKYHLVQVTISHKIKKIWSITEKGREYYTKINDELVILDGLLNPNTQDYTESSTVNLQLIDLECGNDIRRAIIEELEK